MSTRNPRVCSAIERARPTDWTQRFRTGHLIYLTLCVVSLLLAASLSAAGSTQQQQGQPVPKIIRKSGGVLAGSAVRRVEPSYPPLAKAAGVSGAVVVEITIDEEGTVIAAHALSGHPLLRDAAVSAAKAWVFKPTLLAGVPVKVIGTITFNFSLDFDKEIKDLSEKVKQHPDSDEAHYKLAVVLMEAGRDPEARSEFEEAIRLNPASFQARSTFAEFLFTRLNEKEAALEQLKQAAGIDGLTAKMRRSLAPLFMALNQYDLAISLLDRALQDEPKSKESIQLMILACLHEGREDKALEFAKRLVEIEPGSYEAHYSYGAVAFRLKKMDLAIDELKTAVQFKPDSVEAHYGLARAFFAKGDKESALKECAVVEKMDRSAGAELRAEIGN